MKILTPCLGKKAEIDAFRCSETQDNGKLPKNIPGLG